ncbi:MAG: tRNA (N6-isopentenyl adenosine(37)-C2)-methylthiotransferase MiaB [Spirochaetota bacterium]|nr:tRNA (N6-isopentenyl adenosine(37)-C2)-methylthiotransferase MiaB [Spirochaetota bacterium]
MAKLFFETYGCQMNHAEADSLIPKSIQRGHSITERPEDADVIIINTCSVRLTAESHVIGRLGYYRMLNKERLDRDLKIILMGCMSENIGLEVKKQFSDIVSILWGTYNKDLFLDYIEDFEVKQESLGFGAAYSFMPATASKEYFFKAYLPISHGCNKHCSYCIVPKVRGLEKNRDFQDVIDNAKQLVDEGVKEICLLGQTIDTYKYENKRLPDILETIARQSGAERITFLTSHPKEFLYETIELMNTYSNIMPFLHLPFQSGNSRILKEMKRNYTIEQYLEKVENIRKIRPNIILSTDIIVGFPSETEKEFEDTVETLKKVRYNEAFMYRYNTRPNTPAEKFTEQIPEEDKLRRLDILVKTHRGIMSELLAGQIGSQTTALFDRESKYSDKVFKETGQKQYLGRTLNNTVCILDSSIDLRGNIVPVELYDSLNAVMKAKLI